MLNHPRLLAVLTLALTFAAAPSANAFDDNSASVGCDNLLYGYEYAYELYLSGDDTSGNSLWAAYYAYYAYVCAWYSMDGNPNDEVYYSFYAYYYGTLAADYANAAYYATYGPLATDAFIYTYYGSQYALSSYYSNFPSTGNGLGYDPNAPTGSTDGY